VIRRCLEGSALAHAYGNLWVLEHFRIKIISSIVYWCICCEIARAYGNGARAYAYGARAYAYGARAVMVHAL
jgi:hypothetical protein